MGSICDISTEEAKKNILSALCDRSKCPKGIRGEMLDELFIEYPGLKLAFDTLKNGTSEIASRLMCYEAEYFKKFSKRLKENGIDCVIKFDSVIVKEEHENKAKEIGQEVFVELFGYKVMLKTKRTVSVKEYRDNVVDNLVLPSSTAKAIDDIEKDLAPDKESKLGQGNITEGRQGQTQPITPNFENNDSLSGAKSTRNKKIAIRDYKKGYRVSIKNVTVYSEKGENKDSFKRNLKENYGLDDDDFRE